jgi:simple sugar transport system substrate-binding protein
MTKRLLGIAALVAIVFAGLGLATEAFGQQGPRVRVQRVAVIVPASKTDYGWNQAMPDAVEEVAPRMNKLYEIAENAGYRDIRPILRDLASRSQLIFCHASGYTTVCPEFAREANVAVTVPTAPQLVRPGQVSSIDTQAHEAAYLAGVLAGSVTQSNVVGIVVSGEPPTWNWMTVGFAEGYHSVKPTGRLLYGVIGQAAFEDAAGGKRLAEAQLAAGADVIFGQGDGASFGMLSGIAEHNRRPGARRAQFIDVIGNKRPVDRDNILSSVLFDYRGIVREVIDDLENGRFGKQYHMNVANSGVRLLEFPASVSPAARTAVENARQAIVSQRVRVSLLGQADQMRARLRALFPGSVQ